MTKSPEKEKSTFISQYEWMLRPCEMYQEEYGDCTSMKGRFHQYFIYGETLDCSQWRRDLDNCTKWTENNDNKAAEVLIKSEMVRRHDRLKAHYSNDIWERRMSPPEDWNKPLPEYIAKEYENSYLALKAKELKGEAIPASNFIDRTSCVIM